jgi:hypothetical protein
MDPSSWLNWMTRSTIHERNVERRRQTIQNVNDSRPTMIRIWSRVTPIQPPNQPFHTPSTLKHGSSRKDELVIHDTFREYEYASDELFPDESVVTLFGSPNRSMKPSLPQSSTFSSFGSVSMVMFGILGGINWVTGRFSPTVPRGIHFGRGTPLLTIYTTIGTLQHPTEVRPVQRHQPPHQGLVVNQLSSGNTILSLVRYMKTSLKLSSTLSSWSTIRRLQMLVVFACGYEAITTAILGPRSSLLRHNQ